MQGDSLAVAGNHGGHGGRYGGRRGYYLAVAW